MFICALLDVMLEEFGYLQILRAESAVRYEFALFGQVEVIQILVFEWLTVYATELATVVSLLFLLWSFYLAQLVVNVFLHSH